MENPGYRNAAARRQLEEDLADAYESKWQELVNTEFKVDGAAIINSIGDLSEEERTILATMLDDELRKHSHENLFVQFLIRYVNEAYTDSAKDKARYLIYGRD